MGCKSHPYSGLPRNTICSHLICPSELFLMTKTFTGSLYFTHVANSAINMEKPPSPTNATDCRSGYAICAAIAYGKPGAMVARFPDSECIWPRFAGICRAHQVAIVPESQEMMAVSDNRFPSSHATTCGFIGVSILVPWASMIDHHCRIPDCAFSKNFRYLFLLNSGNSR